MEFDRKKDPSIFGKSTDNIHVIDNFISEHDLKVIVDFAVTIDEWNPAGENLYNEDGDLLYDAQEWSDRLCGADIIERLSPHAYEILLKNAKNALKKAEELFNCKLKFREPAIVRYRANMHTPEAHADKQNVDGSPKDGMEDWDVSVVMYFNNSFDGGNLVFPQHNVQIRPLPGRIAVYPGDIAYLHYVDTVTSGVRWACPMFFTVVD